MQFLHPERDSKIEVSLDDVFIVPAHFEGTSRLDVDLTPPDFPGGSIPVVSANMNAVTGKRMAETMARYGGLGVLPQDMALETVRRIVEHIKGADPRFDTALSVTPDATVRDVQGIIRKRSHGMVVVVDEDRHPIGIATQSDLRETDQYTPIGEVMSERVVSIAPTVSNEDAFLQMENERVRATPVVDDQGRLLGILTRDDAVRLELLSPSVGHENKLMVAAAVGISSNAPKRAAALREMGVDIIVLDTAHGHQRRMLEVLAETRKALGEDAVICAGNVCTGEGTRALIEAGADIVKVNVGPGAMCTTRMQTGAGRPTFSAVKACSDAAHALGRDVWADGGVRYPRDVALYLAAGASRVMVGTWLAGTWESPGDIREDSDGFLYKENYGMASARAVRDRTTDLDHFEKAKRAFFREGISSSRIYLREGQEGVGDILINILTGVQSSFTYVGAKNIDEFRERVVVGIQTPSGFKEGTPHGRVRR